MKKRYYLSLFLLAPVALFFAGPRPDPNVSVTDPSLPDSLRDLDDYLASGESRFDDIVEGAEKKIVWADPENRVRTPLSIVYLHGFSATRQEVAPLCDILAERLGANLYYARLAGHGRTSESALGNVSVNDWLQDSVEALEIGKQLGERVIVVATSTGATLSTWLMSDPARRNNVVANVMLSPNFSPKDRNARIALWPWGKQIIRTVAGKVRSWTPKNESQRKYWSTVYPVEAIVTMMSLVDVVDSIDVSRNDLPTLILYSEKDDVISVDKIKEKFPQFGGDSNRLVAIETHDVSQSHVLAGEIIAPEMTPVVADTISEFLDGVGISPL